MALIASTLGMQKARSASRHHGRLPLACSVTRAERPTREAFSLGPGIEIPQAENTGFGATRAAASPGGSRVPTVRYAREPTEAKGMTSGKSTSDAEPRGAPPAASEREPQRSSRGPSAQPAGAMLALLAWGACALLAALAYRELLWVQPERSLPEELEEWFFVPSSSFSPVVVLLSLWLLYRRMPQLRAGLARPGSWLPGAALLAAGTGVYLWATYTGATDLLVPSLMLNASGCAWLWGGSAALRILRLPILILVFAMSLPGPLLNQVVYALQVGTTEVSGAILYALGVPHAVSGERILRPENTFSVIESCSGLRSIETLTIVAILMMDLFRRQGLHAWVVVLAAPPVAFLMNGLRAVALILNPHSEIVTIHNLQGIVILLGGLIGLFLLDGWIEWLQRRRPGAALPVHEPSGPPVTRAPARGAWALAAALAACLAASLLLPRWQPDSGSTLGLASRFSVGLGGLRTVELETDRLFLGSTTFREHFTLRYSPRRGDEVDFFLGLGSRATPGRSALSPKTALPGSGWIVEEKFPVRLEPDGRVALGAVLRSGGNRVLSYHWWEGSRGWPLETLRAFLGLDRSPFRSLRPVRVARIDVAVVGSVSTGKRQAEKKLVSFYELLRPLLDDLASDLAEEPSDPEKTFS